MPVDICGCAWEEGMGVAPCPAHRAKAAKAERIAWRIAAREGLAFDEAYVRLWERVVMGHIHRFLSELRLTVP
jgi:hypothetical protein